MNRINVLRHLVIITGITMYWPYRAMTNHEPHFTKPNYEPFEFARTEKIFPGRPTSEMPPKSKDDEGRLDGKMYQPGLDAKHGNWWTGNVDKRGNPLPTHEEIAQAKFSAKMREANRDGRNEGLLSLLRRKKQAKLALPPCEGLQAKQKASTFSFDTKTSGTLKK